MTLLQEFNINELAGATGLMLGALGGLLADLHAVVVRSASNTINHS